MRRGEEAGGGARMVAAAIAERVGVVVHQAGDHEHLIAERLQRLERAGDLEGLARGLGRPVVHHDAVGHVDERRSDRGLGSLAGRGKGGNHGVQHGQRDGRAHASQKRAPFEVFPCDEHSGSISFAQRPTFLERNAVDYTQYQAGKAILIRGQCRRRSGSPPAGRMPPVRGPARRSASFRSWLWQTHSGPTSGWRQGRSLR